jgi:molybdopterin biosynthesis enzyme
MDVRNIEEHTYSDHRGAHHLIRCEELVNSGWQYVINDRLREATKFYRSAADAASDATDLLIILGSRGPMSADAFRSLLAALDTSLVEGFAAVDATL